MSITRQMSASDSEEVAGVGGARSQKSKSDAGDAGTRDKKIDKKKLQTIQLVIATHKTVQQLHELAKHRQPDFIEFPTVNPFKHQLFSIKQQPKRLADLSIFLADLLRHLREYKIKILH